MKVDPRLLRIVRMTQDSAVDSFKCADEGLNIFLHQDAMAYQMELMSVTYLVYYESELVAYFSLLNDVVNLRDFDKQTRNRINRKIPFIKHRTHYPAVKLGRLAVEERYAHQGIGEMLLRIVRSLVSTNCTSGCRFLTVDAIANATGFYAERGNFQFFTNNDQEEDTRQMYFDLKNFA